ncbi:D-alanine--D-alanine ligase [Mycena sanguinolenta]|uniref:D-alanine--D-alanine ligase n=1 Tax=Mycena sanguinolenta TaxID=230812 RepID=A0A8H7D9M6_9AGAR|nr:D-alanine--D-alanine ligase [Mycena sanguinolenta]
MAQAVSCLHCIWMLDLVLAAFENRSLLSRKTNIRNSLDTMRSDNNALVQLVSFAFQWLRQQRQRLKRSSDTGIGGMVRPHGNSCTSVIKRLDKYELSNIVPQRTLCNLMNSTRVLILAGGRSDEHDVSITSARSLLAATEKAPHLEATVVVVTREGRWRSAGDSQKALVAGTACHGGEPMLQGANVGTDYDVVFPLMHGPFGEDGTVQGMLELAGVPYVGCGVLASAVCMDKIMTKEILRANDIPQVRYVSLTREAYKTDPAAIITAARKLSAPWFVKPANLGSSVGVSKATDPSQLDAAIREALKFDRRAIIEEGVPNVRELEVAILGNESPKASPVGEISHDADFYDYETKYTAGKAQLHIPTDAPACVCKQIQEIAIRAYQLLDCAGFARVDFFYQPETGRVFLNELNTIPGFTPFSMFPRLWEAGGIPYGQLVEHLVKLAQDRHKERR